MYVYGLPNSNGNSLQGSLSKIGQNLAAGLPNLVGQFTAVYYGNGVSGVFSMAANRAHTKSGADGDGQIIEFSASKYNSIYGASTTVQPPALLVSVLIKHD